MRRFQYCLIGMGSLFLSSSLEAAMNTFVQQSGQAIYYGLSTDVKPSNPPTDFVFIEKDTGKLFRAEGGLWVDKLNNDYATAGQGGLGTTDIDTSAELQTILTDETGTGKVAFATSPTFLGGTSFTNTGLLVKDTDASNTLAITPGSNLTGNRILTIVTGDASTTMTLPTTSATLARTDAAQTFTGHNVFEGITPTGATGTALMVFATTPTLTTPVLNHPTVGISGTAASSHVLTVGTAPSCTFSTGGGTTPSCALQTGSTDHAGTMILTTGSGSPSSAGTVTLTFNATMGTNSPVCVASLTKGAVDWSVSSTVRMTTFSTTAPVFTWNSQSATALVNLTASTAGYDISYICYAK